MRTSVEGARGCGYRVAGGLYIVSDGPGEVCEFLPHELHVCPTCSQGIKPARGWTWVDGAALFPPRGHGTSEHNAVCPFGRTYTDEASRLGRCGLIWVGETFYKTPQEFMREASRMGISRRITAVPRDFKVGETWVLLGHRKAVSAGWMDLDTEAMYETMTDAYESGTEIGRIEERFVPGVFSAFKPERIEYIVRGDETADDLAAMEKRGIEPVEVIREGESVPLGAEPGTTEGGD